MTYKRLEEMKNDYENISIPKELEMRVKATIETAKAELSEMPEKKHRSRTVKWIVRTAGMAAAAMLAITILANSSQSIAYAMSSVPVLGAIVKVVTFREYTDQKDNMEANIKVPGVSVEDSEGNALEAPSQELNQRIEEYTSQIIAAYEADVAANNGEGHESVNLDYSVITDNDTMFALRFDQFSAMASGEQKIKIYNLDKNTGAILSLKDLFTESSDYINVLTENIKAQMRAQMAADENINYLLDSEISDDDFTTLSEEATFYINKEGQLVIVFDQYDVAPGYMGSVEFVIPTDVIQSIVKDGYVK